MRILITGVGGPAAVSVWKSLKDEHELYMADIDPNAAGLYLEPANRRLLIPKGNAPDFVTKMLGICSENQIEVLISTVDSELAPLAAAKNQFLELGIKLPLCSYETLKTCYDKYALLTACQSHIPTPEFILLNEHSINEVNSFPRFAKPRHGAGSNGITTIYTKEDLKQLPLDNSYLVQELLPGEEYSVDTYIDSKGNPIAAVPRLRMKIDSGVAVTARTMISPELSALAVKVATLIGIRYVANIQFKRADDGQFKLLEINPRFSGALPLTTEAGVDIPKLLIQDLKHATLPQGLMPFKDLMVVRYWTEKFISPQEWEAVCQTQLHG